ncbi:MAG: hypothetical protein FWD71_11400 [Oscillospiraceae bacterium]|nr:hypothetical protein [Oscillospiraceae bacterium]
MVYNEKELGQALKQNELEITVDMDSKAGKAVVKIKATGAVAWGVCAVALTTAIGIAIANITTAGTTNAIPGASVVYLTGEIFGIGAATTILGGFPVALSAVIIGVAGGGIGALNKLRKYKMQKSGNKIILTRK